MNTPLVLEFQGFVNELVTTEKKNIVALTEIARDALQTNPQAVPSLAKVIITRIMQVWQMHPLCWPSCTHLHSY